MDTDDLEPAQKKAKLKNLEIMSIDALKDYINDLTIKIDRAKMKLLSRPRRAKAQMKCSSKRIPPDGDYLKLENLDF